MKTVGDKLEAFAVTGVNPGKDDFFTIDEKSFAGKWKVIAFYPKDFTFVCPTEIVAYDKLHQDFADRDAVLLTGSTDNEFCKLAWQASHEDLKKITTNVLMEFVHFIHIHFFLELILLSFFQSEQNVLLNMRISFHLSFYYRI